MSEIIDNSRQRKELLKHIILQLHEGVAPEMVKERLINLLQKVPYGDVVEVEQELISEGLPIEEVLKLCDIHTLVLEGHIDQTGAARIPQGHPVDIMKNENIELMKVVGSIFEMTTRSTAIFNPDDIKKFMLGLRHQFNLISDVEKHYQKKENLIFPFMEKAGITGPPKVMWGKHDETRAAIKSAIKAISSDGTINSFELQIIIESLVKPAIQMVSDMIYKEEEILFPMVMDKLTEIEWYQIYRQIPEIGYCLHDPDVEWKPAGIEVEEYSENSNGEMDLGTGALNAKELIAILSTLPVDITFVDKDDKVKFFSHGAKRIFQRNRAILKRDVRMCHPPSSVDIVEQIINDFKSGKESKAPFWINFQGKYVLIEYFAVRDNNGEYMGTLEVTQDITQARALEGEQRLLSYSKE